jgi:DNA-binding MarR family transcriptional regulator
MSEREDGHGDHVDHVLEQWRGVRPELDVSPVGVIARLGRAAEHIDARRDALLGEHGLNRALWDVLASLRRQGPPYRLSPTDLYRELMRTSGAMTHRLAALERAGLVSRVPAPTDGRSMLVELTPRGRRLVDDLAPDYLALERRLLAALDADQEANLAAALRTLLLDLEADEPDTARSRRRPGRSRAR